MYLLEDFTLQRVCGQGRFLFMLCLDEERSHGKAIAVDREGALGVPCFTWKRFMLRLMHLHDAQLLFFFSSGGCEYDGGVLDG